MKKLLALALAVVALLCCLGGCAKEVNTITDFSKFSDMTQDGTDKIEVTFDNYSGYPFYFTIEDQEDIDEIMDIIFSSSFAKMKKEVNGGDHTSMKIFQGEKEYRLHAFMNKEGQYYYSFSNTDLQTKIQELAREAGAFDYVNQNNNGDTSNKWGVSFEVENVTAKGLTIHCRQSGGENVFELNTGSFFVIQKKENSTWVDVEYVPQEHDVVWTTEAWAIHKEDNTTWDVDWEWLYGELPAGEYRIGKEIMNFRGTGDFDKQMVYAEFKIK